LDRLDDRLDNIRSDILQLKTFPTIEQAYAHVKREDTRQAVMTTGVETTTSGAVMTIKGSRFGQPPTLVMGKHNLSFKPKGPFDGGKCTHCGNTKHTSETCFKLHGYPEWWHELQARREKGNTLPDEGTGRAATVTTEPQLSLIPMADSSTSKAPGNCGQVFYNSSHQDESEWIIDSRATDHMTFILQTSHTQLNHRGLVLQMQMESRFQSRELEPCHYHPHSLYPTLFLFLHFQTN
jgi:hypothetical protein